MVFAASGVDIIPWPNGTLKLSIAEAILEEPSGNTFLDAGETARLKLVIRNSGGSARNIEVTIQPSPIAGVQFKNSILLRKLRKNKDETIRISMTADKNVKAIKKGLTIQLLGKTGLFGKKEEIATEGYTLTIIPALQKPAPRRGRQ